MSWWRDFADRIERDAPVGRRTWFRLGGRARYLFRPADAADLAQMVRRARQEDVPLKVLGSGANVLISDDGFDGVVVRLDRPRFRGGRRQNGTIEVGAGVDLMVLSRRCSYKGLSGLECMAGIPATVGGAVRMNAGGRFGDFSQAVKSVRVLRPDGVVEERTREQVGFGYRRSGLNGAIVLSAELALNPADPVQVRRRFDEYFEFKRQSQPIAERSAGCTAFTSAAFKGPVLKNTKTSAATMAAIRGGPADRRETAMTNGAAAMRKRPEIQRYPPVRNASTRSPTHPPHRVPMIPPATVDAPKMRFALS